MPQKRLLRSSRGRCGSMEMDTMGMVVDGIGYDDTVAPSIKYDPR